MRKKVILYVGGFELPDKNAAAQRCVSNAKIFREIGYEVVFLGFDKQINVKQTLRKKEFFGFDSWAIPYPQTGKQWLKYITSFNEVDNLVKREYKGQVFVVICYNYPAISQYRIKRLSKKLGIYAVADVTEWYGVSGNNLLHKTIKLLDTVLRMRVVNPMMDALITTSPYLSEYYKKNNINYVELPTLYDLEQLSQYRKHDAEEKISPPVLMYAGSPFEVVSASKDRNKVKERLDILINIMFSLSAIDINFVLNIFGITEEDYLKVYPEDTFKLDALRKKVFFKGRKPHGDILENIVSSDFTVFFRDVNRVTQSGFPSKFSESISCGTPVITNFISNIGPYMVAGKNCFLIDINNENLWFEQIKSVLSLDEERIVEAKQYCFDSNVFDYRNYVATVNKFIKKLEALNNA